MEIRSWFIWTRLLLKAPGMNRSPGIRVLDLTRLLPGGVATQQLADWGAEVIKIEQPRTGDYGRQMSPAVSPEINSGKKSVCLDLKQPRGREFLLALARAQTSSSKEIVRA